MRKQSYREYVNEKKQKTKNKTTKKTNKKNMEAIKKYIKIKLVYLHN